jgi:hypothetical protein
VLHSPPIFVLTTRKIFGEDYRSLSSQLCSFLHSPVTSSLLGSKYIYCLVIYIYIYIYIETRRNM